MKRKQSPAQKERNRKGGQGNAQARRDRLIDLYGPELGEEMFREQMQKLGQLGGRPTRKEAAAKRRAQRSRPVIETRPEVRPVFNPPEGILAFKLAEARTASEARRVKSLQREGAPGGRGPGKEFGRTTRAAGVP